MNFECYLRQKYNTNEPIFIENIEYKGYSRSWIFGSLKKMVDDGVIKRFDKGVYYFPQKMSFGYASLDPAKVIKVKYLSNDDDTYGYITGLSLINSVGLSTQCPNMLELVSNNESSRVRDIKVGFQKVRARRPRITVNKENVSTLQFLDLISLVNPSTMDETQEYILRKYIKNSGVTLAMIKQFTSYYPIRTMRNLVESGAVYDIT